MLVGDFRKCDNVSTSSSHYLIDQVLFFDPFSTVVALSTVLGSSTILW